MMRLGQAVLGGINFRPASGETRLKRDFIQIRQSDCLAFPLGSFDDHRPTTVDVDVMQEASDQTFHLAETNGKSAGASIERWQPYAE